VRSAGAKGIMLTSDTTKEHKMEWIIALIAVTIMPLGMILWWIPRCDGIGVRKAKDRIARERTPSILTERAA
jgi:hypothetical protein